MLIVTLILTQAGNPLSRIPCTFRVIAVTPNGLTAQNGTLDDRGEMWRQGCDGGGLDQGGRLTPEVAVGLWECGNNEFTDFLLERATDVTA